MPDASGNAPLALAELKQWVSEATVDWLQDAENEEAAWRAENEVEIAGNGAALFAEEHDSDEEKDPTKYRVRVWCTSRSNPDGIFKDPWISPSQEDNVGDKSKEVRVVYILSESWQGYGDILWASARHISNMLGHPESCCKLLAPSVTKEDYHPGDKHPLLGLSFLELGAGAGVPSWTAMRCGARVVCTDQAVPDRIRSIAECAERNWREMNVGDVDEQTIKMAGKSRACALDWGGSVNHILECLDSDKTERFDVIVAADCCYMPWLQPKLLESIDMLLSNRGVALVPFALHGNAKDDDVWGIVDRAKERNFQVEVLEPKQLTPPNAGMDSKQALVHTIRLTR